MKHGLKMSGMPAWGVTHDDELLWDVVAFLRKLPELTPDQYQAIVKSAPRTHEQMMQEMENRRMECVQLLQNAGKNPRQPNGPVL